MKKNFKLEGLDCANCAAKMEKQINELPMVTAASVRQQTAKPKFEFLPFSHKKYGKINKFPLYTLSIHKFVTII